MPKRSRNPDPNVLASMIVDEATGGPHRKKNPAAVALGRLGGQKGGPARAARLTPEQRSASARKAVQARWAKKAAEKNAG